MDDFLVAKNLRERKFYRSNRDGPSVCGEYNADISGTNSAPVKERLFALLGNGNKITLLHDGKTRAAGQTHGLALIQLRSTCCRRRAFGVPNVFDKSIL